MFHLDFQGELHLGGTLTDLMVVPLLLLRPGGEAREGTGYIADGLVESPTNARMTA